MIIYLCSLIAYTQSYYVYPKVGIVALPNRFGFQAGGNYTINVTEAGTDSVLILIARLTKAQHYLNSISSDHLCNASIIGADFINVIQTPNGNGNAAGTIKEKGMYYTVVAACSNNDTGYSFSIQYINPKSFLSYDEQPCLITLPIVAGVTGVLFIIWLINWFINFSLKNSLHLYMTIGIFFTVIYDILYIFEYRNMNISDSSTPVYTARKVFRVLQETVLLSAMLMASEGWCIIHNIMPLWRMLVSFLCSAAVASLYALIDFMYTSSTILLIIIIVLSFCVAIYILIMLKGVERAKEHVVAHLYVIAENGIDPQTTPIYAKYKLFNSVVACMFSYFILLLFRSVFSYFWQIPRWITQMIYDVIIMSLISVIAFAFRMKKETKSGYMMVGDEEGEPRIFDREDIQSLNPDTLSSSVRPYEDGMVLPAQPFITENKKKKKKSKDTQQQNDVEQRNQELLGDDLNL